MTDEIVVVDDGQTYVSTETAEVATEAAAQAKLWAQESERQANLSAGSAETAVEARDDAVAAKEYAEAAITDTNLITVATDLSATPSNIKTVATNISNVNSVATNISNVNAVAGNATNINAVNANKANIDAVAGNASNINAVNANKTNINAVAGNATNINAVNANKTNIDKVATDINKVKLVADDIASVHTVAVDISNVIDVADNKTNIDTVASNISNINTTVSNLPAINAAPTYANQAAASAELSAQYANDKINQTHISNCITEIPQDINLTLSSGTLTLKAGSKVYVPNGKGVFDTVTTAADYSLTFTTDGQYSLVLVNNNQLLRCLLPGISSSSEPSSPTTATLWYDTTNNVCKRWSGEVWAQVSFPFAIFTVSSGVMSSIDQVFNGFGYIGSTVFALPGVKGLIPNGRNADGTLKSIEFTTSSVLTRTTPNTATNSGNFVGFNPNYGVVFGYDSEAYYDENLNQVIAHGANWDRVIIGTIDKTSGNYNNLNIKTPFHAVDYNDFKTADDNNVKLTGNQSIAGTKTFTNAPYFKANVASTSSNPFFVYQMGINELPSGLASSYSNIVCKDNNNNHIALFGGQLSDYGSLRGMRFMGYGTTWKRALSYAVDRNDNVSTYCVTPTEDTTSSTQIDTVGARNTKIQKGITNCITEIPQDLEVEIDSNNGNIVLKSGSKVYDGTGYSWTLSSDMNRGVSSLNGTYFFVIEKDGTESHFYKLERQYSQNTQPSNAGVWFNTDTNETKWSNTATNWLACSLPIAIITTDGTNASIDQVFNGFGYIGSTVFALPGVKGLIPNGRNTDGTLKNTEFEISGVLTQTITSGTFTRPIILKSSAIGFSESATYDEISNKTSAGAYMIVGEGSASSGVITSLTPKTAFHAVDYNDSSTISGWAMPSSRYIDLTLGASGSTYTAPANGYFAASIQTTDNGQYLFIEGSLLDTMSRATSSGQTVKCYLPVRDRDTVKVAYNAGGSTNYFRFVYAQGEK